VRTLTLVSLASHVPIEPGDCFSAPGVGRVMFERLSEDNRLVAVKCANATLSSNPEAVGLAWVDVDFVRARPPGGIVGIDHDAWRLDGLPRPAAG
jgi:hypothetical protein